MSARENLSDPGTIGRVDALADVLANRPLRGRVGLGHTRWATHGGITEPNAHPHICRDTLALVCNGIVENHETLRHEQHDAGLLFTSETDTEVVVHQIYLHVASGLGLVDAVRRTLQELEGSFAFGVVQRERTGAAGCRPPGPAASHRGWRRRGFLSLLILPPYCRSRANTRFSRMVM